MKAAVMFLISRIIGNLLSGETVTNEPAIRVMIKNLAALVALATMLGMMAGAMIIGGFYGIYLLLLAQGLNAPSAILAVGFLVVAIIVTIMMCISNITRNFLTETRFKQKNVGVMDVAHAFVDGLLEKPGSEKIIRIYK